MLRESYYYIGLSRRQADEKGSSNLPRDVMIRRRRVADRYLLYVYSLRIYRLDFNVKALELLSRYSLDIQHYKLLSMFHHLMRVNRNFRHIVTINPGLYLKSMPNCVLLLLVSGEQSNTVFLIDSLQIKISHIITQVCIPLPLHVSQRQMHTNLCGLGNRIVKSQPFRYEKGPNSDGAFTIHNTNKH